MIENDARELFKLFLRDNCLKCHERYKHCNDKNCINITIQIAKEKGIIVEVET